MDKVVFDNSYIEKARSVNTEESAKSKTILDDRIHGPLRYDPQGQMIWDSKNLLLADIRGWGEFQYRADGEVYQDTFGQMMVDTFNEKYFPENKPTTSNNLHRHWAYDKNSHIFRITANDAINACSDWDAFCKDMGLNPWMVNEGGGEVVLSIPFTVFFKYYAVEVESL